MPGDEAGRRLAAVQLVRRRDQALAADGVAGLVPARRGPKGASKLMFEMQKPQVTIGVNFELPLAFRVGSTYPDTVIYRNVILGTRQLPI